MARGRPALPIGTMGSIHYREKANGRIEAIAQVRLNSGQTKKLQRVGKSRSEAERRLKIAASEALSTNDTEQLTTTSKITDLLTHWLEVHEMSERSREVYESTINRHITPKIGDLRLNEASVPRMDRFVSSIDSPAIAKRSRSILSSAFGMASRFGLITANPIRETRVPKTTKKPARALTPEELSTFRQLAKAFTVNDGAGRSTRAHAFPNIVDFLAGTGVRISEALNLRWSDLDLDSEPATAVIHATKTNSKRVIQLPELAVTALENQARDTGRIHEWVFPTSTGKALSKSNVERWFRNAKAEWSDSEQSKDLPDVSWVTPHSFRRTVATLLSDKVSLSAASQQLGHSDSTVTEHHYIERPKQGPAVAHVLDQLLPKTSKKSPNNNRDRTE